MKKTHGYSRTRECRAWYDIRRRCGVVPGVKGSRPRYVALGMAEEWRHDFEAFLAHIGPCPGPGYTVERIDNERGYLPGNVRWATLKEQARNTRRNVLITWNGETLTAGEWSERTGISYSAIYGRIYRGWSPERALTTPVFATPSERWRWRLRGRK